MPTANQLRGQRAAATRAANRAAREANNNDNDGALQDRPIQAAPQDVNARLTEQALAHAAERHRRQLEREDELHALEIDRRRAGPGIGAGAVNQLPGGDIPGEQLSPEQLVVVALFPHFVQKHVIAIANIKFFPENIQHLATTMTATAIGEENEYRMTDAGTFTQKKVIGSMKEYKDTSAIWSQGFLNWLSIWNAFNHDRFDHLVLSSIIHFHNRIVKLAETYQWQNVVLQLAILRHRVVLQTESFLSTTWVMPQSRSIHKRHDEVIKERISTTRQSHDTEGRTHTKQQ